MKGLAYFFCLVALTATTSIGQSTISRIEILTLYSRTFRNSRNLRVYLPPNYDLRHSYKVLYLNDGQNVFGGSSLKPSMDWRVDEIADSLILLNQIEPIIIVGIDNMGLRERGNEYLPWKDNFLYPPIEYPQGSNYPKFLKADVIPLITSRYKVKKGKEHMGIGGFSYGALISTFIAIEAEDQFGFLLLESPSLYVNDHKIIAEASKRKNWPTRIYAGVGTNELNIDECDEKNVDNLMAVKDVESLLGIIKSNSPQSIIKYEETKCGIHSFQQASKRLPTALIFLFGV